MNISILNNPLNFHFKLIIILKKNQNLTWPRARGFDQIEEKQNSIQEAQGVAHDENEEQTIRERERITENQERINVLESKRELEEGTSLRERVRNIFKKYCFTGSAVVLAAGTTTSCLRSRICHINKHRSETVIITFFEAEVCIWWNSKFCSYSFERWRVIIII